ncbi:hypothetical protein EON68_01135, partial [archaeon]
MLEMRDKYLRKGGFMQPSSATICLAGMTDEPRWHARVAFWKDVYGFNMKNMVRWVGSSARAQLAVRAALRTGA